MAHLSVPRTTTFRKTSVTRNKTKVEVNASMSAKTPFQPSNQRPRSLHSEPASRAYIERSRHQSINSFMILPDFKNFEETCSVQSNFLSRAYSALARRGVNGHLPRPRMNCLNAAR